jgi:hypothetical protein
MRYPQASIPPLPADPPAPARSGSGQVLRHRLLRHENPEGSEPRASGEVCEPPGRLGGQGQERTALPVE